MLQISRAVVLSAIGVILLIGCGGPSPIAEIIDFVGDDPAAKRFLKGWPLPEGFEQTGNPTFQRTSTISADGQTVRFGEIHISGVAGALDQNAVLEFYRTTLPKKGYEVTDSVGGLAFKSEKWSGEVTISAESPPVISLDAVQGE